MLSDESGYAQASWFHGAYLARVFERGQRLVLHGKVTRFKGAVVIQQPDYEIVESGDDERLHTGRLVPVYSLTEGLAQRALRALLWRIVDTFARDVPEALPERGAARDAKLVTLAQALRDCHFPETDAALGTARRRLTFDDFLLLQLGLAILRSRTTRARGVAMNPRGQLVARLRGSLPWPLTGAQERVWNEIRRDMAAPFPMHRLLQGDVGSGKTIVAALAVLTAIEAGYQAAVMRRPRSSLSSTSSPSASSRAARRAGDSAHLVAQAARARRAPRGDRRGDVACVVGTHALVQEVWSSPPRPRRRGRAAPVRRRAARPAPRQGRAPRPPRDDGHADPENARPDALRRPRRLGPRRAAAGPAPRRHRRANRVEAPRDLRLPARRDRRGRQAYVVYPLVEESEALDLKAATDMARHLRRDVFPDLHVGLITGGSVRGEGRVMRRFKAREIHILVSTTVIEVGIDVANASVMLVEHAEALRALAAPPAPRRVGRARGSRCAFS